MKITVLGAAGAMGTWLAQYFAEHNHVLTLFDPRMKEAKTLAKTLCAKFEEKSVNAVKEADMVVLAVPIDQTKAVLEEISPHLKRRSIVAEISSVKSNIVDQLAKVSKRGVYPLSIHPLFGPGIGTLKKKIALIPVVNPERERAFVEKIFPDAQVITVSAKQHDKAMATVLSIPNFMNVALAAVLSGEDLTLLSELGGTTFTLQVALMGSVMTQSSQLQMSMHTANEYAFEYLKKFLSKAQKIRGLIEERDTQAFEVLYGNLQKKLSKSTDLTRMYQKTYAALKTMEK